MEKNPQGPSMNDTSGAVPPSYEQATSTSTSTSAYPPVQVLPTPQPDSFNHQQAEAVPTKVTSTPTVQTQPQAQSQPRYQQPQPQPYAQTHYVTGNYAVGAGVPPQHAYGASPPMVQQPVVIIQQQQMLSLGPEAVYLTCPSCHVTKLTRVDYEPSSRTHLMAALLCVLGLWCCVCLPYCADSCMNANHYCGNCNKFLGTYGGSL